MLNKSLFQIKILLVFIAGFFLFCSPAFSASANITVKIPILNIKYMESGDIIASARGFVKNTSANTVRGLHVRVKLIDENNTKLASLPVNEIPVLQSSKSIPFEVTTTLTNINPSRIRAIPYTIEYESVSYMEIADFITAKQKYNLDLWNIKYPQDMFTDEKKRAYKAVEFLNMIDKKNPNYKEAQEKINGLFYSYAVKEAQSLNYHESVIHFFYVNEKSHFYNMAQRKIIEYRAAAIYKRAMEKAVKQKKYLEALEQMRTVPRASEYYDRARERVKNWEKIVKDNHLRRKNNFRTLTYDQKKIAALMEGSPDFITDRNKGDNYIKIWWYPNYSHFNFNKNGKLINSVIYP